MRTARPVMNRRRACRFADAIRVIWVALIIVAVPAPRAETLTIATYNVENYGPANRMTEAGYRQDYPKPEAEKESLRHVIRALNADVLVMQEMGAQPYLDELQRDLRAEGCDYPHAALAAAADNDRHVAVLSRRPLLGVMTYGNLEFAYLGGRERVKRGLLQVTIKTTAGDLTLFAVHLKSRFTDRADDPLSSTRRIGEAAAIRDAILQRFALPGSTRFLVLGDCNDTKASKPLERLQHRGDTAIAKLLPATDSRGESWTYFYRREDAYERFDHILVSPGLADAVPEKTAHVFDGEGVLKASDHRPVYVRLQLGP